MDAIGLVRGWRYLDHAAHLGGAAFGAAYWKWGPAYWADNVRGFEEVRLDEKAKA